MGTGGASERERERESARRTRSSAFNKKYMRKILGNSSKRNNKQRTCGGSWVFYQKFDARMEELLELKKDAVVY
jgi:hypothetical protein